MSEAVDDTTFNQLREMVQRFVAERLVPNEMRVEVDDEIPEEIVAEMRELGLFGLTIPPEYGGIGLNARQETQIARCSATPPSPFALCFATNIGIGARGLIFEGTQEQKQQYLPAHGQRRVDLGLRPDRARYRL